MRIPSDLLRQFREGDPAAFAAIVREFDPLVRRVAGGFFRSASEREDAMQEVWTHVYRNREALDPERLEAFPGWLAVMARRRCLDLARSTSPGVSTEAADDEAALAALMTPPAQEASAEAKELEAAVAAFRGQLRAGWAEFFDLHFVQGWDYERVATRLRISRLRCKYMKKVLAEKASRDLALRAALGRRRTAELDHAH